MDKRFFNFFNLTEDQAIALLDTPQNQISESDSRYIAASHLVNFPTERSVQALIRAVQQTDPTLDNRIVRRKSVETLGRLQAVDSLPIIHGCLQDSDCYTVENAVWAIGEIGTNDPQILADVTQLLTQPQQTHRVIIHTLAKLGYTPALEAIRPFCQTADPPTASAAITAICRLTGDYSQMPKVVAMLQHLNVLGRRLCIQDLIDANYFSAIPEIAQCPVSLVFRLRGIRLLAEAAVAEGALSFAQIQPALEQSLYDHPHTLKLVHTYDQPPTLEFLIRQLYETDFGRCYLATQTILTSHVQAAPAALFSTYTDEACQDYGAHFHVVKLMGWLKHAPAYDLLITALHNTQPQFQKSRAAAAIALAELGDPRAVVELKKCLQVRIWDLQYAALMALSKLGDPLIGVVLPPETDWLVREKLATNIATPKI
jgi:bilin biosynthesis protein